MINYKLKLKSTREIKGLLIRYETVCRRRKGRLSSDEGRDGPRIFLLGSYDADILAILLKKDTLIFNCFVDWKR